MKITKKIKLLVVVFTCALLALLFILCRNFFSSKKRIICTYALSESQQKLLKETTLDFYSREYKNLQLEFINLKNQEDLLSQIKKNHSLLFAPAGLQTSVLKSQNLDLELLSSFPSSLRSYALSLEESGKSLKALPVFLDINMIELNLDLLKKTKTASLESWTDLENFALKSKEYVTMPLVFAGGDSFQLIDIFGAMTESLSGAAALNASSKSIRDFYEKFQGKNIKRDEVRKCIESLSQSPESPFYPALYMMRRWYKLKIIKPEVLKMDMKNVLLFMKHGSAGISFIPLSGHRASSPEDLKSWQSLPRACGNGGSSVSYYPSVRSESSRQLPLSAACVFALKKYKDIEDLLSYLVNENSQEKLCRLNGLVPVSKSCQVPDQQSSDARWWLASSEMPVTNLSLQAFRNKEEADLFASVLAELIRN